MKVLNIFLLCALFLMFNFPLESRIVKKSYRIKKNEVALTPRLDSINKIILAELNTKGAKWIRNTKSELVYVPEQEKNKLNPLIEVAFNEIPKVVGIYTLDDFVENIRDNMAIVAAYLEKNMNVKDGDYKMNVRSQTNMLLRSENEILIEVPISMKYVNKEPKVNAFGEVDKCDVSPSQEINFSYYCMAKVVDGDNQMFRMYSCKFIDCVPSEENKAYFQNLFYNLEKEIKQLSF